MKHSIKATLVASVIIIAGCSARQPETLYNKNVLVERTENVAINYTSNADLSIESSSELANKIDGIGAENIESVTIVIPSESRISTQNKAAKLSKKLVKLGVDRKIISTAYSDSGSPIEAEIKYSSFVYPDCDKERTKFGDYYMNYRTRELGCAHNNNLALQISNKKDTIGGSGGPKTDATNTDSSIKLMREGYAKASSSGSGSASSTTSGK